MTYVKAKGGPPNCGDSEAMFTVQYFDELGNLTIRSGGSRAWRCNNPGNLRASKYSTGQQRRCVGTAGSRNDLYAVYPDYETGHEALIVMLKGKIYSPLTLREALKKYDSTNLKYIDIIISKTKLDPERTIKSLSESDFNNFWKAIEETEKWQEGREDFIEKWHISGVHLKRGVICEYCIFKNGCNVWIPKEKAIELACEHRLHAIIVHRANGSIYLRSEYNAKAFNKMAC